MPRRTQTVIAATTIALLAAVPAFGQEATGASPPTPPPASPPASPSAAPSAHDEDTGTGRVVGGHVFMPAGVVPGALVTTSASSALRFGAGKTTASTTIGDRTFEGTMQYAGIGGALAFEFEFLQYFSARVTLDEIVYSGTSGRSAIVVGTTGDVGASVGLTAGVPLGSSARVAVLFDVNRGTNAGLNIATGIKRIVDACQTTGCDVPSGPFFEQLNLTEYQPALALNWAPVRALGVTAHVGYAWATASGTGGDFNAQGANFGLALDFDFRAISSVPIGLMTQFRWSVPVNTTELQHVTDAGGGVFYTGREHLAIGLQLIDRRFAVSPNVNVSWTTWLGEMGLRYYW